MSASREALAAGDLSGALAALKGEVRAAPRDGRLRTFLFQMFCVTGEWERALQQLTVAAELDPLAIPMAETYRTLIRCEGVRAGVFAGTRAPTVLGRPEPWVALLLQANRALAAGATAQAAALRDEAFEGAEAVPGTLDGRAFEWVADADPRLGPVFEAVVDGAYHWVPMARVSRLALEAPADLRDQVWMPAEFTWTNGGRTVGFIPTRYPGSEAGEAALALARRTEWRQQGAEADGWALGLGQRMLATEAGEVALMDLRLLTLDAPAGTAAEESQDGGLDASAGASPDAPGDALRGGPADAARGAGRPAPDA